MSPEAEAAVTQTIARIEAGEQPTVEEMVEVVKKLRAGRISAAYASSTSKAKTAKAKVEKEGKVKLSGDDLLNGIV